MKTTERKIERNIELMQKRESDAKKWSWKALADHYGFSSRTTAFNIYNRTKKWLSTQ